MAPCSASPALSPREVGRRRLHLVSQLLMRDEEETVADIARAHGRSRQWAYGLVATASEALVPRSPGPAAGSGVVKQLQAQVASQQADLEVLRQRVGELETQLGQRVEVTERRRDQLELVCFAHNVSLRGTQEVLAVAWGEEWRPGRGTLHTRMRERGRRARELLDAGRAQVADTLPCVMADDVYFHRQDVKVVAEPESMAMLHVGHWDGASGLDWVVWLEEFTALRLLVSDLGRDLVGAATQLGLPQCADFFHEDRWFDRKVLAPLSRWEAEARAAYWTALQAATRTEGPGRRLSPDKVDAALAEADARSEAFFAAMAVTDRLRELYEPTNPQTGRLWTDDEVRVAVEQMLERLGAIDHAAGRRAAKHLRSHRDRYTAHRVMIAAIAVPLRPDTTWSQRSVLNGVLRLRALRRQLADPTAWVDYPTFLTTQRLARDLERRLRRATTDLDAVERALVRELRVPKRSSSGVESLNSKLRVLQMVHRHVSDEMLALVAMAWNLTPRRTPGWRQGQSPYGMLGIDIGQGDKPWYDVVLDAQARSQQRAVA